MLTFNLIGFFYFVWPYHQLSQARKLPFVPVSPDTCPEEASSPVQECRIHQPSFKIHWLWGVSKLSTFRWQPPRKKFSSATLTALTSSKEQYPLYPEDTVTTWGYSHYLRNLGISRGRGTSYSYIHDTRWKRKNDLIHQITSQLGCGHSKTGIPDEVFSSSLTQKCT